MISELGSEAATDPRATRRWYGAAVVLAAVLVYANSLGNGFAYDDVAIIAESPRVHGLDDQAQVWLTPYWTGPDGRTQGAYRPLTVFAFALEWAVGGGSPLPFHIANVALHALVSLLVFLLLVTLAGPVAALVGGLVFAVHPVHAEAVANVVGQAELLSTAAVVAACLIYSRRAAPVPGAGRLIAIALLYLAGLFAKENAIVLPGLLLVMDLAQQRQGSSAADFARYSRAAARPLILLIAVAGVYLTLRTVILGSPGGGGTSQPVPFLREPATRVLTALQTWPEYLRLFLFPADLSATYEAATLLPARTVTPSVAFGALLLGATAALALLALRRPRLHPAAWFLVTILPASNLLFPVGIVLAERTLYLPSVALSAAAALGWAALPVRVPRYAVRAVFALVLLLMAARTVIRNPDWRDTDTIFAAMMRDHPESLRPHWYFAGQALERGDTATADRHYRLALERGPEHPGLISDLGVQQLNRGHIASGIRFMERSRALRPLNYRNDFFLGLAHLRAGDTVQARQAVARLQRQKYLQVAGWLADSIAAAPPIAPTASP